MREYKKNLPGKKWKKLGATKSEKSDGKRSSQLSF